MAYLKKERQAWKEMINGCTNPLRKNYKYLGGRGITVCDRWLEFKNFYEDVGPCPESGMVFARVNRDDSFHPGNARWMTKLDSVQAQSNAKIIVIDGISKSVSAWAKHFGISPVTVGSRLAAGWDAEQAIKTPAKEIAKPSAKYEVGQKIGMWTIIGLAEKGKRGHTQYVCRCECGSERIVPHSRIANGSSASCGCTRGKFLSEEKPATKHGNAANSGRTPEYTTWKGMKIRCYYRSGNNRNYWGRGIYVCDRWRESFENFLADMGRRPGDGWQIDRIDNDGPYSPENCRWVPAADNARNKSNNRHITAFGETKVIKDWESDPRCKVSRATIRRRLGDGWTPEDAISANGGASNPSENPSKSLDGRSKESQSTNPRVQEADRGSRSLDDASVGVNCGGIR